MTAVPTSVQQRQELSALITAIHGRLGSSWYGDNTLVGGVLYNFFPVYAQWWYRRLPQDQETPAIVFA